MSAGLTRPATWARRLATSTREISRVTYSVVRMRPPTMPPTRAAMSCQLAGMSAVCGMGMPSGWRKSAVTANQSASPPTTPASAMARIHPPHHLARQRERGDGEGRGGEQDDEGEAPLVPRLAVIDGELDQLAAQTSTR